MTDNKPLFTILGPKKGVPTLAAAHLQRWALILSAYDYEIDCRKSADHSNCDSLSRLPLEQRWPDENTDFEDSKDEDWEVYFAVRMMEFQSVVEKSLQQREQTRFCREYIHIL